MSIIDWIFLLAYLGGTLFLGFVLSKKQKDDESFFLGGRNMPWFAVTISIVATSLSAGTFVGMPQISYRGDLTFVMLNIGSTLGGIIAAVFLIPALYRANTLTIYGFLKNRFGPRAEVASSWFFLVGVLLAQGARHFIASIVVSLMLFGSTELENLVIAIVLLGVIATVYTAAGGIHAVIWTDVIQVVILTGAAITCIISLVGQIPLGIGEIIEALRNDPGGDKLKWWDGSFDLSQPYTAWSAICAYCIMNIAQYGCDQDMTQRMMTCQSPRKAMWSMVFSRIVSVPIVVLFLVIGLLLHLFYARPDLMGLSAPMDSIEDTKNLFPQFILTHLPPGIVGISVAGMLAASMSSFDSAANGMASVLRGNLCRRISAVSDQDKKASLRASRGFVCWMGGGLTIFAVLAALLQRIGGQALVDFSLGVLTFAYSGLFGVFMTALFTTRGNERSVIAALAAGALVVLLLQPFILSPLSSWIMGTPIIIAWPWWMVFGGGISFLVCSLGSPGSSDVQTPEERQLRN